MHTNDGWLVDGSWNLSILVEELNVSKTLRVNNDLHIGGLMFQLVEKIDVKTNWSDHGLWWVDKKQWLLQTRSTLVQCGVQADARFVFMRMHNNVKIMLPDLQIREMKVNFAKNVFKVVIQLCKELNIRHPEELSLLRFFKSDDLKMNKIDETVNHTIPEMCSVKPSPAAAENGTLYRQSSSLGDGSHTPKSPGTGSWNVSLLRTPQTPNSINNQTTSFLSPFQSPEMGSAPSPNPASHNGSSLNLIPNSLNSLVFEGAEETMLANSPSVSAKEVFESWCMPRYKSFVQKARINGAWLSSSKSLMEQGIFPAQNNLLMLRFKYLTFYDLNPKYDAVRINQIFEQAKWTLLSDEYDTNEEEAILFAALQLQALLQVGSSTSEEPRTSSPQPQSNVSATQKLDKVDGNQVGKQSTTSSVPLDEVDFALMALQMNLNGEDAHAQNKEVFQVPELSECLKVYKQGRLGVKSYKQYWLLLKDTVLYIFKRQQDVNIADPLMKYNLKGSEVYQKVSIATQKFVIQLIISENEVAQELRLKCENQEQYANWITACTMCAEGRTLASQGFFKTEVENRLKLLKLQTAKAQPILTADSLPKMELSDFVSAKHLKKYKPKILMEKIACAHSNVRELSLIDAKIDYIKAWQRLSNHGVHYMVVRFEGSRKEEILGISANRVIRVDGNTGTIVKSWRSDEMMDWRINWNAETVILNFGKNKELEFHVISCNCSMVSEFVGGYVFMCMRTPAKNQQLNEAMFHKLTGASLSN